jgi:deoxyribodipyrimidine photo-lyase
MKKAIVWFTKDLRVHDNAVLNEAIHYFDEVFPIYCLEEAHFGNTPYGFQKTGKFRKRFLKESLLNLNENLKALGSGLVFLKGKPEMAIKEFASKHKVEKVFAMFQIAPEERAVQQSVKAVLQSIDCKFEAIPNQALFWAKDLPFSISQAPDVFTTFRNKVESKSAVKAVLNTPERINTPAIEELSSAWNFPEHNEDDFPTDSRAVLCFKGGETEALKRLSYYVEGSNAIVTYKNTRNQMIGERYSTKFSPWLAMGCLSPRQVYHQIKKFEKEHVANESTYWVIFELLWREYFMVMMQKYPYQFFVYEGLSSPAPNKPKFNSVLFQKWIDGKTGKDFIDANMVELKQTGFMSNRGRQNVASYLCHDLNIDWRYGAAYFEEQLIDYDVSSNWCNWAYIAGVGNNPRGKSVFNIEKQANDYDRDKSYRKLWLTNI